MEKVLVTGAGGFIGTKLCRLLWSRCEVIALDRFFFGSESLIGLPNVTIKLEDTRKLHAGHLLGVDYVFDLAAISNDSCGEYFAKETFDINYLARERLCKLSREAGVKKYFLVSSCSVYGKQEGECTEHSPLFPLSVHARANVEAEQGVLGYADQDFCVCVLRLSTIFGVSPRMRFDLSLNNIIYDGLVERQINVPAGKGQYRPFLHLDELLRAFDRALEVAPSVLRGQIFNVGDNASNLSFEEIAYLVRDRLTDLGHEAPVINRTKYTDERSYRVNFSKFYEGLGWRPQQDLAEGIGATINDIKKFGIVRSERRFTLNWYAKLEERRIGVRTVA